MTLTPAELEAQLRSFVSHLLSPLLEPGKSPVVRHQVIKQQPLTVRLGMRASGVDPEHIKALAADGPTLRKAWLQQWRTDNSGIRDSKSVAISGDDKHVIMDLIFFTLEISTPDSLTPADPAVATAN